jgi:hypothetical protein
MILVGLICFFVHIDETNKDLLSFVLGVFPITGCIVVAVIKIYAFAKRI